VHNTPVAEIGARVSLAKMLPRLFDVRDCPDQPAATRRSRDGLSLSLALPVRRPHDQRCYEAAIALATAARSFVESWACPQILMS
jgi:hypothetical protein